MARYSRKSILAFVALAWAVVHTGLVLRCSEVKTSSTPNPGSADSGEYQLAARQSGGFFRGIRDDQWEVARQIFLSHHNHRYMDRPLTFHPDVTEEKSDPEIYAKGKTSEFAWGFSSVTAWYQNVSRGQNLL